jgi:hypothetical protein
MSLLVMELFANSVYSGALDVAVLEVEESDLDWIDAAMGYVDHLSKVTVGSNPSAPTEGLSQTGATPRFVGFDNPMQPNLYVTRTEEINALLRTGKLTPEEHDLLYTDGVALLPDVGLGDVETKGEKVASDHLYVRPGSFYIEVRPRYSPTSYDTAWVGRGDFQVIRAADHLFREGVSLTEGSNDDLNAGQAEEIETVSEHPDTPMRLSRDFAVRFREGGNALVRDVSGRFWEGPVLASGGVKPTPGEFCEADVSDPQVQEAIQTYVAEAMRLFQGTPARENA